MASSRAGGGPRYGRSRRRIWRGGVLSRHARVQRPPVEELQAARTASDDRCQQQALEQAERVPRDRVDVIELPHPPHVDAAAAHAARPPRDIHRHVETRPRVRPPDLLSALAAPEAVGEQQPFGRCPMNTGEVRAAGIAVRHVSYCECITRNPVRQAAHAESTRHAWQMSYVRQASYEK